MPGAAKPGAQAQPPDLLTAALICNADGCPPESCMQVCRLAEDYVDGCCADCWRVYLLWVYNGRPRDPYLLARGGGLIG